MKSSFVEYWTRRRFIAGLSGVGLAASIPLGSTRGQAREPITKPIPSSGEQLPVIGMGSSRTFDVDDDPAVREGLAEVLQAFFDGRGAVVDSSPMYGQSEQVIGDLLASTTGTDRLFAATKVWTDGRQAGVDQMHRSMERMNVKVFDLMQIHNLRDWRTHLETLKEWKAENRVRYIGITTSHGRGHAEFERILDREPFDFVQFSYSVTERAAEQRLLPLAVERGIATLINRPFARGALFGRVKGKPLPDWTAQFDCESWGQFFLKFIVSHPAVTCAIPATSKVHHMHDNMGAAFGRLPDADLRRRMVEYYEAL